MDNLKSRMTGHALKRIRQRGIPASLIDETIKLGHKITLVDRKAYEYTLKNILGLRGVNLKVIQGFDGAVLTSYIERIPQSR